MAPERQTSATPANCATDPAATEPDAARFARDAEAFESTSGKAVPAVRRAAAILWMLAERGIPLGLSEVARGVGILPSTALQILREMSAARLVAFDPTIKVYKLGSGIVDLAQTISRQDDFAEIARPYLQIISDRFDVTSIATAVVDMYHTACVVSISPPQALSLNVTLGGRVPILSGAVGRCIAAFCDMSHSELKSQFARIRWQTSLEFDRWCAQVQQVRQDGYAEDAGDFALGVTTLAAPVIARDGTVTRAVGIATISAALDAVSKSEIGSALAKSAKKIGEYIIR